MSGGQPARKPVLFQLPTGTYLGIVCFNPNFETLKFVLEKKEFFEVEWPAIIQQDKSGLIPIFMGIPYIVVQRTQILWYTQEIPPNLLQFYENHLPHPMLSSPLATLENLKNLEDDFLDELFGLEKEKNKKSSKSSQQPNKTEKGKIIPFPGKKHEK